VKGSRTYLHHFYFWRYTWCICFLWRH